MIKSLQQRPFFSQLENSRHECSFFLKRTARERNLIFIFKAKYLLFADFFVSKSKFKITMECKVLSPFLIILWLYYKPAWIPMIKRHTCDVHSCTNMIKKSRLCGRFRDSKITKHKLPFWACPHALLKTISLGFFLQRKIGTCLGFQLELILIFHLWSRIQDENISNCFKLQSW